MFLFLRWLQIDLFAFYSLAFDVCRPGSRFVVCCAEFVSLQRLPSDCFGCCCSGRSLEAIAIVAAHLAIVVVVAAISASLPVVGACRCCGSYYCNLPHNLL